MELNSEQEVPKKNTAPVLNETEKKQNRKIDISLILSIAAILVSLIQVVISSPFFTDFYYKSYFEIEEEDPYLIRNNYITMYSVTNPSKNTVNNIEISIEVLKNDTVEVTPNNNIDISFKEQGPAKSCYFKIDKLVSNEEIVIIIHTNADSLKHMYSILSGKPVAILSLADSVDNDSNNNEVIEGFADIKYPQILFAKHDKGSAKIKELKRKQILHMLHWDTIKH